MKRWSSIQKVLNKSTLSQPLQVFIYRHWFKLLLNDFIWIFFQVRANSEKQLFYLFQLKESRARRSGMLRRLKHRRRKERKRSRKGKKRGKKRLKKNARKRRNKKANKNLAGGYQEPTSSLGYCLMDLALLEWDWFHLFMVSGSRFTWCSLIFGIPQVLLQER